MSKKIAFMLTIPLLPTMAFAAQPWIENESATYSKEGIVINAEVLRKTPAPTPATLPKRQEVEDDTLFNDTQAVTEDPKLAITEPVAVAEPAVITHNLFIYPDESYFDAINRWLKNAGYQNVAWSIDDHTAEELKKNPAGIVSFAGSVRTVLPTLSKQLGVPFYLSETSNLAAIHQWHNREVQIVMVRGSSMKVAIEQLASDYGWNWSDDTTTNKSWLAKNDYPFSGSYPLVTPKNDIAKALRVVLEGYPISAKLLTGTQSLFIVDTQ